MVLVDGEIVFVGELGGFGSYGDFGMGYPGLGLRDSWFSGVVLWVKEVAGGAESSVSVRGKDAAVALKPGISGAPVPN